VAEDKQVQLKGRLEEVKELCQNRDRRVKELKGEGRKVIGYFCCYAPIEILTAANLVPYRILGNIRDSITVADTYMEPTFCPYTRSCFDVAMKGGYDVLDGYLSPDSCDNIQSLYRLWTYNFKPAYDYWLSVPHLADPASVRFFKGELVNFKNSIEEFAGSKISDQKLNQAIQLHNQNRALSRALYELRKPDPPLVYGSEVTQILVACMSLPVEEANELVKRVIAELRESKDGPQEKLTRLLIAGNEIDDPAFVNLVEECGANVVTDDLCIGTKFFWHDVETTEDPFDGLTTRYLEKIMCARTYRGDVWGPETRQDNLEERFGHVRDFARDFNAKGAILYVLKYCDPQEWDAPDFKDYLEQTGLPVLHIEHDYTLGSFAALRTRIQAFLEMIS